MKNILLVDDDQEVSQSVANLFDSDKYQFEFLEDGDGVKDFLQDNQNIDLVMLDVNLPSLSGLEVLKQIRQSKNEVPVIVISGFVSTDNAIEAMKEGAYEYLTKPFQVSKLLDTVNKACGFQSESESIVVEDQPVSLDTGIDGIVGKSPEIVEIAKMIGQVAKSDAAVLIFGESGTGKEVVSRSIHRNSRRSSRQFLSVNCAALPDTLLESELFGHEKGAFTGAYYKRIGKFEQADGGTLFLDEIGDMSMLTQSKLLRVLQDGTFERVGSNQTIKSDVRILAATNKSLVQAMKEGSFRVDLFYRLKVVSFFLPPLRERRGDIPLLIDHFLDKLSQQLSLPRKAVTKKALQQLSRNMWPGNVRELENNIHTALVMSKNDDLQPDDFPSLVDDSPRVELDLSVLQDDYTETFRKIVEPIMPKLITNSPGQIYHFLESALERAVISTCLKQFNGNQVKTSETLGISRNTLRDRIAKYNLY
ncbi:MAG: sigma-54-dependent Fis family transcriptional regulator [candidate division Zixibacteria bacterium]|nr:sigma-54-dependent Fis family transcriptional regulator [candidate division Zixibacteria bacterium]